MEEMDYALVEREYAETSGVQEPVQLPKFETRGPRQLVVLLPCVAGECNEGPTSGV